MIVIEKDVLKDILIDTMIGTHGSIHDETYDELLRSMYKSVPRAVDRLAVALENVPVDKRSGRDGLRRIRRAMDRVPHIPQPPRAAAEEE